MIKYIVQYNYYQYNSGQSDNGYYLKEIFFKNYDEALSLYHKIKNFLNNTLSEYEKEILIDDYIPYSGFFTDVKILKCDIQEILI
jgi:hypothetical protein